MAHFDAGPLRLHVSIGSLPEVIDAYTALTGRPTPPPRWALGHHQARWGYGSTEAVRAVWQGFAENDLPLSAMHLDIDHMEGFRNFTFGTEHWAGIGDLIAEMAAEGVRTVVIVDAGIARDDHYPLYPEGVERGLFCANAERLDLRGRGLARAHGVPGLHLGAGAPVVGRAVRVLRRPGGRGLLA